MCIFPQFEIVFQRCWCRARLIESDPLRAGLGLRRSVKVPWGFLLHRGFGSRTTGLRPGPPLDTLIFRTKCHLLVWAKIKRKVTGITSCTYSLEHVLLGGKKRRFCLGFAGKKESSVCFILIWNKPHSEFSDPGGKKKKSSGIWRKQMDPRLQSREECLGNQKNIMVYKFLVRFQPAALSWILCKTPGTLVNWKVTWIIVGLGPYCNDEVRKKENTGLQSEEERKE